ncbi:hypothetical protein [Fulvimarina manganoxydans]|uniref:hypothetical protein n=1 Tax=Fulvimarina manganoxydans TaxID=937218 RepID=UPI001FCCE6E6|nr:hypothetical protein [Fulvimarina manganoxydans]
MLDQSGGDEALLAIRVLLIELCDTICVQEESHGEIEADTVLAPIERLLCVVPLELLLHGIDPKASLKCVQSTERFAPVAFRIGAARRRRCSACVG